MGSSAIEIVLVGYSGDAALGIKGDGLPDPGRYFSRFDLGR